MTTLADRIPVDELSARSREVRPGRVALIVISAIGVAIGWVIGWFFRGIGRLAGYTWLILVHFGEAVVYGFRESTDLPQPSAQEPPPA